MAKDIKLYKDGYEVTINETQLENFLSLGYKQEQDKQVKPKKDNKKWQHPVDPYVFSVLCWTDKRRRKYACQTTNPEHRNGIRPQYRNHRFMNPISSMTIIRPNQKK